MKKALLILHQKLSVAGDIEIKLKVIPEGRSLRFEACSAAGAELAAEFSRRIAE